VRRKRFGGTVSGERADRLDVDRVLRELNQDDDPATPAD
jgi:hypothetical protein